MGLFWDLLQQKQLSGIEKSTQTLEQRVDHLERELTATQERQQKLIELLELHFGQDIDGDGRIG